jgi:uncharacterized membrane protein YeiH
VPGEVTLATGAVYAARGQLDLLAVMAMGALAAMVGESWASGWDAVRRVAVAAPPRFATVHTKGRRGAVAVQPP